MAIKKHSDVERGPGAIAAASLLGAAAASLCCVLPLILFGLGLLSVAAFAAVLRRSRADWLMAGLALGGLAIWFLSLIHI